ncbi:MAG TPA: anthranilate synthase component I [Gammaproteobacteria bacterium]|nr:anthranilate synthase component I [Gammaproteobacteria bacterium]
MSKTDHTNPGLIYETAGGIRVRREEVPQTYARAADSIAASLDERRGVLLTSSFEYPGRYTRWDIGFIDPVIEFTARGRNFTLRALSDRGSVLLPTMIGALDDCAAVESLERESDLVSGVVRQSSEWFPEELRSKQPSVFSVLRAIIALFSTEQDTHLGFYGAFGYELAFQFEPVRQKLERDGSQRDLVLYLPDEILIVDHRREVATLYRYDFETGDGDSRGLERIGEDSAYVSAPDADSRCDHAPGEYADTVREAIERFRRGDLFEVVPSQTFFEPCPAPPSEVFRRLKTRNPAPYGALMNLGEQEYLVAASPEMYVRVEGRRIETCPISGTIKRGINAIGDAAQILELLSSEKETSELTMCTDVDRNDKSRVCEPGSIQVIGRRQIEMYSRLIHTVDHVEGILREGYDALDGFLAHTWAVTVTGAPKQHAIQFIEDHERSPRCWYGGAMGFIGFNGNMNTGLTLRTVRIKNGIAEVRAGATLLFESDPDAEEQETRLKASALLDAINRADDEPLPRVEALSERPGAGKKVLMVDHEDSFVHTLAGYFRQTGAEVVTYRCGFSPQRLEQEAPDLILLSPGPGRPEDFRLAETIRMALEQAKPIFGVCLGLQGIVEYYGGSLEILPKPVHGKNSRVRLLGGSIFEGVPRDFEAGRYHSLFAVRDALPEVLEVTAETDDGLVMAIEHRELPIAAVQFHPESIMTLADDVGLRIVSNVVKRLAVKNGSRAA